MIVEHEVCKYNPSGMCERNRPVICLLRGTRCLTLGRGIVFREQFLGFRDPARVFNCMKSNKHKTASTGALSPAPGTFVADFGSQNKAPAKQSNRAPAPTVAIAKVSAWCLSHNPVRTAGFGAYREVDQTITHAAPPVC